MSIGEKIRLLSANCQGIKTNSKMHDVLNYLKDKKTDILCLQDTPLTPESSPLVRNIWNGECVLHGLKTNSRGVAIMFGANLE